MTVSNVRTKTSPVWVDAAVIVAAVAVVFGVVDVAREWHEPLHHAVEIDLSPWALPQYALFSLARGWIAYGLSLVFILVVASWAFYDARARRFVLPAHPGRIDVVLPVTLPYPRDPDSPGFRAIVAKLHAILTRTNLPDTGEDVSKVVVSVDQKARRIAPVSLPYVTPAEVVGLLSVLGDEDRDVFELTERLAKEFAAVVSVLKAAELLGLVETPGQDVRLTPLGREVLGAATRDQRRLIREQLMKLKVFELLTRLIRVQERGADRGRNDARVTDRVTPREAAAALPHAAELGALRRVDQLRPAPTHGAVV